MTVVSHRTTSLTITAPDTQEMESILERSRFNGTSCWIDIANVGGGAARLYLLNGGTRPPKPVVGDFTYDFKNSTMQVYDKDVWKPVTIQDVESRLWHPTGNGSMLCFTDLGLPFWMSPDEGCSGCEFGTVDDVLCQLRERCDTNKIHVSDGPSKCYFTYACELRADRFTTERRREAETGIGAHVEAEAEVGDAPSQSKSLCIYTILWTNRYNRTPTSG